MKTIIIGAGASGLACAIESKRLMPEVDVLILERQAYPGKRIYATGGGKCNLSNVHSNNFLDVEDFFISIGIPLRVDSDGRAYPYCEKSAAVVEVLTNECKKRNVEIKCSSEVKNVKKIRSGFSIETDKEQYRCDNLVLATGGIAQPSLGGIGNGYEFAKSLGHSITPLIPALVQLKSPTKNIRALSGIRAKCQVDIYVDDEDIDWDFGEVLFTDYGLSGIVIMNLSHNVSKALASPIKHKCKAVIDFVPDMSDNDVLEYLNEFGNFIGLTGKKISEMIFKEANGDIELAAKYIKHQNVIINGTKGFDNAQITWGGFQ